MSTSSAPPKIACPHCQALIKAPTLAPGSLVNCPKCGQGFRLGQSAPPAGAPKPAAQRPSPQQPPADAPRPPAPANAPARPAAAPPKPPAPRPAFLKKPPAASAPPPPPPPQEKPKPKLSNWVDPQVPPLKPPSASPVKPLPPLPAAADDAEFVPLDFSAAAATQPAGARGQEPGGRSQRPGARGQEPGVGSRGSRKPPPLDGIVDPNLLPPPPPRAKPKVTQVPVVCRLCSTRLYAPVEQVGQTIRCPDCHTVNEIKLPHGFKREEPKPAPPPPIPELEPAAHPSVADVWQAPSPPQPAEDDIQLAESVERPTYRPLVEARGEYAVLRAMDPDVRAAGWSDPGAEPHAAPAAKSHAPQGKGAVAFDPEAHEVEEEFKISEPVERIEIKPEPVKLPLPDPEESIYDGRYDDELFGEGVDPRQPEAWKRSPFLIGIVEFLFYPNTLARWLSYSLGLAVCMLLVNAAVAFSSNPQKPQEQAYAILCVIGFALTFGLWLAPFCTAMLSVIQDTANGSKDVENWPDWNLMEWFYPMLFVPFAVLLSGLPGMFLSTALVGSGLDPRIGMFAAAAPLMLSWIALFPIVMYSMCAEGSVLAPVSPHTWRSWKIASEGWIVFYMASILIAVVGTATGSFMLSRNMILTALGAWGTVTCALLYARLLGRLMWYTSQKELKLEAAQRGAAE